MKSKSHRRPLNRSITIGCTIFIMVLCVILSASNLALYQNYVYQDYQGYIADLLDYTLSHIDGDDLRICIETGEESETYRQSLRFMDDMMNHFDDIHYFYAVLPLNTEETGNTMSVLSAERYYDRYIDTEGNLFLGWVSDDEFDAATAQQFMDILHGDSIVYFVEQTEWGIDYTGAIPIRDSQGDPVAVLAMDIDLSFLTGMILRYAAVNICIILVLGCVFILLFLLWSRRNITMPIRRLEQSAVGFADHSHGRRDVDSLYFEAPEMKEDNEIKALSDAVVKMTSDIRTYVSDIISAERKAEKLKELANRDSLTGVFNKTAYDNDIRRMEEQLRSGNAAVGLAIVDLNYLKRTNDTFGHDKGDKQIISLCKIICSVFSHSPVYRIGGDEFAVILTGEDYQNFDALKREFEERIRQRSGDTSLPEWKRVSAALGAAFYDSGVDSAMNSVFQRADQQMYLRKTEMKAQRTE